MLCSQKFQCVAGVCASETRVCEHVFVRMCAYFSPVLGRASLIGSQTQGISVLHNGVGRHGEDGPRDSLSASEREASFWNTASCYSTALTEDRHHDHFQTRGDLIIMIV